MMVPVGLCGVLQGSRNGTKCMLELGGLPVPLHAGDPQEPVPVDGKNLGKGSDIKSFALARIQTQNNSIVSNYFGKHFLKFLSVQTITNFSIQNLLSPHPP